MTVNIRDGFGVDELRQHISIAMSEKIFNAKEQIETANSNDSYLF